MTKTHKGCACPEQNKELDKAVANATLVLKDQRRQIAMLQKKIRDLETENADLKALLLGTK